MLLNRGLIDNVLLIIGIAILALFLLLPERNRPLTYYSYFEASSTLKGEGGPSDITQDIIGFRALVRQQDPYPILGPAARELGLEWDVNHTSTHPPTAFLLVAPIAFLPWNWAAAFWAWLMLVLLVFTFRCFGISWKASAGLVPVALLWPPIATSLGQMTIIWLLAVAVGYHFQSKQRLPSAISIAVSSLAKFFPGLLAVVFLLKRQWHALLSFVSVWILSLVILVLLHPQSIFRYIEVNRSNSPDIIWRADNSSLLLNSYRAGGWIGVFLVLTLFILILWTNRDCFNNPQPVVFSKLWMLLTYFSVSLLPVFWIYSVTPLLPIIISLIFRKKLFTMTLGCCCLAIPVVVPAWGTRSVLPLVVVNLMVGTGLLVDALPFRMFTAVSLKDLVRPSARQEYTSHR